MSSAIAASSTPKLSVCIATFNRPTFIGATLQSILSQVTSDCEIMILDSGSTDETEKVVRQHMQDFAGLRYVRQDKNNGLDRDYDRVVKLASGEYCWLMTDDDLLKPGAIAAVLQALEGNVSLVVVNVESMDVSMTRVLRRRWLDFELDRRYEPEERDRLFADLSNVLSYIGSFVIKREVWNSRERKPYYGSWFIHLGVIFQERLPGEAVVIAEPLISYRTSNTTWSARASEIYLIKWPSMVWSLDLSESTKRKVCIAQPWKNLYRLLMIRGYGFYSLAEYRRWVRPRLQSVHEAFLPILVALLPGALVNTLFVLYYAGRRHRSGPLQAMRESRFHFRNWRFLFRRSQPG